jgi:exopolyphosphatase/pppGpp-phosphohydrolase
VLHALDLAASSTGELSPEVRAVGTSTLSSLATKARELGCVSHMPGIATAVFRKVSSDQSVVCRSLPPCLHRCW